MRRDIADAVEPKIPGIFTLQKFFLFAGYLHISTAYSYPLIVAWLIVGHPGRACERLSLGSQALSTDRTGRRYAD